MSQNLNIQQTAQRLVIIIWCREQCLFVGDGKEVGMSDDIIRITLCHCGSLEASVLVEVPFV